MADTFNVFQKCSRCKGEGTIILHGADPENPTEPYTVDCPKCDGDGKRLWGRMEEVEA